MTHSPSRNKGYAAYPRVSQLGRGVRVFLGRFPTKEARDAAVKEFRKKYPDTRYRRYE